MKTLTRRSVRIVLLALTVAAIGAPPAAAQWAVFDAATTARNRATAALTQRTRARERVAERSRRSMRTTIELGEPKRARSPPGAGLASSGRAARMSVSR